MLSAGARAEGRAIPAKGLTGTGYDGHSFWDTDLYIVPVLTLHRARRRRRRACAGATRRSPRPRRAPAISAWPARRFPGARSTAKNARATGPPEPRPFTSTPTSPPSVLQYVNATGDDAFERDVGIEILVETARLWRSLGHFDLDGNFRIDGVTGPDEYSAIADNNSTRTSWRSETCVGAAGACQRHQDKARELGVTAEEMAALARRRRSRGHSL